jgi:hypothetical protein
MCRLATAAVMHAGGTIVIQKDTLLALDPNRLKVAISDDGTQVRLRVEIKPAGGTQ